MQMQIEGFARDERGAIALMAAIVMLVLCLFVGGAVDYARYTNAKSETVAALDTGVLAGARTLLLTGDQAKAIEAATRYYNENVAKRFEVTADTVQFSVNEAGTAVSGSGNAYLPTTFLKIAGIEQLPLVDDPVAGFPKASISGGGGSNLEIAVMLDVTGSMCDDGEGPCASGVKLNALKAAAADLINIVVLDDQSTYTSRVALVPFSQYIRVEPNGQAGPIMKAMTNLDPTWTAWHQHCTSWQLTGQSGELMSWECTNFLTEYRALNLRPCITDRFFNAPNTVDYTDDPPGPNAWLNGMDGTRHPLSLDSADTPPTAGTGSQSDPSLYSSHYNYEVGGYCPTAPQNVIQPLTSNKTTLLNQISGLNAERGTGGALGTAVTWYMLSPKWSHIWPAASEPGPYAHLTTVQPNGKPKLRKVAILMSDGVYNTIRGWSGQNQQSASNHAKQLCANMKAEGIEIYTVAFDLDSLPSNERAIAEDTLKSCGSSIEHFYNSFDPEDLKSAFRDIAIKLSTISLTR